MNKRSAPWRRRGDFLKGAVKNGGHLFSQLQLYEGQPPGGETAAGLHEGTDAGGGLLPGGQDTLPSRGHGPLLLLFVWLDRQEDFPWPDYSGLVVNVQDCWRDRKHPEIFQAVRSCLGKMRVQVREMEENRERSVFCGNLHFEPHLPENIAPVNARPGVPLYDFPEEEQARLFAEQTAKYTAPLAVTYCNRCTAGISLGGGKAVHLMELAMETYLE